MDSQLAEQDAMYSTSAMLRAILDYFLLKHEIIGDPRQKNPLELLFLSKTLSAQSPSI